MPSVGANPFPSLQAQPTSHATGEQAYEGAGIWGGGGLLGLVLPATFSPPTPRLVQNLHCSSDPILTMNWAGNIICPSLGSILQSCCKQAAKIKCGGMNSYPSEAQCYAIIYVTRRDACSLSNCSTTSPSKTYTSSKASS